MFTHRSLTRLTTLWALFTLSGCHDFERFDCFSRANGCSTEVETDRGVDMPVALDRGEEREDATVVADRRVPDLGQRPADLGLDMRVDVGMELDRDVVQHLAWSLTAV